MKTLKTNVALIAAALALLSGGRLTGATSIQSSHRSVSLYFEPNAGQFDPAVQFVARGSGPPVGLLRDGAAWVDPERPRRTLVHMKMLGSKSSVEPIPIDPLPGRSHYILGGDRRRWKQDLPHYARVRYRNVYPGIDLIFYGEQGRLEYDWIVAPGADPGRIRFSFPGARRVFVDNQGGLVVESHAGKMRHSKPVVYQQSASPSLPVGGRYLLLSNRRIGLQISPYDRRRPVIIDPVLSYSSYIGGSNEDRANAVAVDGDGNIYIAGRTDSANFPVTDAVVQKKGPAGTFGLADVFVMKLDPGGKTVLFSTYLGGGSTDQAVAMAVDADGNVYITGITQSQDFPVTDGAFQTKARTAFGVPDAFVAKLDASGARLVYSTFLAGNQNDHGQGIVVDGAGNAYVTGWTASTDFPATADALQTRSGGVFVVKLNAEGTALIYSARLGSSSSAQGRGIAIDVEGNAYVTGETGSAEFTATPGAFQSTPGGAGDAFVAKLNPTGSALVYSTYLGGSREDRARAIAVDAEGNAYVTGIAYSPDFPVKDPVQATCGCRQVSGPGGVTWGDAFVSKLDASGGSLIYSTFLGGAGPDGGFGIAVDAAGQAHVAGTTSGIPSTFPLASPIQSEPGGSLEDAFIAKLNASGAALLFSSLFGGRQTEEGLAVAVDKSGDVYVVGNTGSSDLPVTDPTLQSNTGGGRTDIFLIKISNVP